MMPLSLIDDAKSESLMTNDGLIKLGHQCNSIWDQHCHLKPFPSSHQLIQFDLYDFKSLVQSKRVDLG